MATYNNYNYNTYDNTKTKEGPQNNRTVEGEHTITTTVGPKKETTTAATNQKSDDAYKTALGLRADVRNRSELGYTDEMFDPDKLLSIYNQAAQEKYDAALTGYGQAVNEHGRSLNKAQDAYLQAMRQANANAIASGAARGTQAANELSTMLGLQQQGTEGMAGLSKERADLALEYAKELAENRTKAEAEVKNRTSEAAKLLADMLGYDENIIAQTNYGMGSSYVNNNFGQVNKADAQTTTETHGKKVTKEKIGGKTTKTTYTDKNKKSTKSTKPTKSTKSTKSTKPTKSNKKPTKNSTKKSTNKDTVKGGTVRGANKNSNYKMTK